MQRRAATTKASAVDFFDSEAGTYEKSRKISSGFSVADLLSGKSTVSVVGLVVLALVLLSIIYVILPTGSSGVHIYPRPPYESIIDGPKDKTERQHRLIDWLYSNGFWVDTSAVILKWLGDNRGVGLLTLKEIPESQVLFKVPKTLFWSILNDHSAPETKAVVQYLQKQLDVTDKLTLSSFMFMLDHRNKTSFWRPYLDSLPFPFVDNLLSPYALFLIVSPRAQWRPLLLVGGRTKHGSVLVSEA